MAVILVDYTALAKQTSGNAIPEDLIILWDFIFNKEKRL